MADVATIFDANVKGVVACVRVLPGHGRARRGHIVNISSIAGVEWYGGGAYVLRYQGGDQRVHVRVNTRHARSRHVHLPRVRQHQFRHRAFKGDKEKGE